MRSIGVLLHRWFGLATAVFLFIAGLTGAVIAWDHELDAALNPELYRAAPVSGSPMQPLQLAELVERADHRVRVTYLPLAAVPDQTVQISVEPRVNPATGELYEVDYNQVAIHPVTGTIQGTRDWGAISLSRENLLPFLYKLHYSMHLPELSGVELGVWLMGLIGIVWVLDCFIALYLSFPRLASWRKSLAFRFRQGSYKLNFDLHRSGGVWVWLLLLMLAVTSVSMNLNKEVMRPVVSMFSSLSPSPFDSRKPIALAAAVAPAIDASTVIKAAQGEAAQHHWSAPPGALFHSSMYQVYGVGFFQPDHAHGDGSTTDPNLGNPWLYFDDQNGQLVFTSIPGEGTKGDIFMQAQFPLHSGRIIGVTGRIMVSLLGLMVATLSVTGVVIWMRKRVARQATQPFVLPARTRASGA